MTKKKKPGDTSDSSGGGSRPEKPRMGAANHSEKGRPTEKSTGRVPEERAKIPPAAGSRRGAEDEAPEDGSVQGEVDFGPHDVGREEPDRKNERLEEELGELKDQLLRKQADFENFRKRLSREKADGIRYSNQMLLLDLLPVIDDFERAIASAEESKDFHAFHDGVVLIERQLTTLLEKNWGLKRFESLGEEFSPDRHQAIALEENEEVEQPTVIEDYQKGYFYHDRVLRPAKVKVAQPKRAEGRLGDGAEESQGE